jgi:hypothetical protein
LGRALPLTARYIQELTDQLSRLASQNGMPDLAYLLRKASEEAEAMVETITESAPPQPGSADDEG